MQDNTPHFRRLVLLWLVSSAILTALVIWVLAPGMPPGDGTVQSSGQVSTNTVLFALSVPVALAVLLCLGYSLVVFRERPGSDPALEGPAVRGNSTIQLWWLVITTTLVLFLAAFGSVELLKDGAGGGQGPNPLTVPPGHPVVVQVIAQQWEFTYRYPGYGGFETNNIEIPANSLVEFNVTSLDVIHSFWAFQLGVKADANPGENNVAYLQTNGPLFFNVRCAELCGVFHGYMFGNGHVVSKADFTAWAARQENQFKPVSKSLPPYNRVYFPAPNRRGG